MITEVVKKRVCCVRFKEMHTTGFIEVGPAIVVKGDYVICKINDCEEIGEVILSPEDIKNHQAREVIGEYIRKAYEDEIKKKEKLQAYAEESIKYAKKEAKALKLEMKFIYARMTFDEQKLIIYFTAPDRVDFRQLVKRLAKIYKRRIELRQIGVRDETKILGGIGQCGYEICCSRFLWDFENVTIKMAKDQTLNLNPVKISGICSRLLCCLHYEYYWYLEECVKYPSEGEEIFIDTDVKAKVIGANYIKGTVLVETLSGTRREITLEEVKELNPKIENN